MADDVEKMANEAHSNAAMALRLIEQHEKECERRQKATDSTLKRIESGVTSMSAKVSRGLGEVHGRVNQIVLMFGVGAAGVVITIVGATLAFLMFGK